MPAQYLTLATTIDKQLIQAYRETEYRVVGDEPFILRVDEHSPELDQAHARLRIQCSAFVTACNPYSEDVGETVNQSRHEALRAQLHQRSLGYREGLGQHPSDNWLGEPSFLVFGISLEAAKALCRSWEQNALIYCGADAVPRLELLR